jgi:hypothetical protein
LEGSHQNGEEAVEELLKRAEFRHGANHLREQ